MNSVVQVTTCCLALVLLPMLVSSQDLTLGCEGEYQAGIGDRITDGPGTYPAKSDCAYVISEGETPLRITIEQLSLETGYDEMFFVDKASKKHYNVPESPLLPYQLCTNNGELLITFESDGSAQLEGWNMTIAEYDGTQNTCANLIAEDGSFALKSFSWWSRYWAWTIFGGIGGSLFTAGSLDYCLFIRPENRRRAQARRTNAPQPSNRRGPPIASTVGAPVVEAPPTYTPGEKGDNSSNKNNNSSNRGSMLNEIRMAAEAPPPAYSSVAWASESNMGGKKKE